jgi:hypothetical protein
LIDSAGGESTVALALIIHWVGRFRSAFLVGDLHLRL